MFIMMQIRGLARAVFATKIKTCFRSGVLMAETLHWLNAYEPMFYPLVMTVKIWGREHHLTSQGLGCHFSNHMLTMLVLAYLQQEELLPALKTLYARKGNGKSIKKCIALSGVSLIFFCYLLHRIQLCDNILAIQLTL